MKFLSLKILTDENISPKVVSFLREKGIDIIDTKEEKWHGREDEYLLEKAFEDNRFILTHDSDFGTLAVVQPDRAIALLVNSLLAPEPLSPREE
jgi:predicted nuclease of predicted toxin-antitoxin system